MAKFRVWYRADEIGPDRFIAVAACVPDGAEAGDSPPMESECRVFRDRDAAVRASQAMAAAISQRVSSRGHEITKTEGV